MVVLELADEEFHYWDKHIHACTAPERCRIYISSVAGKSSDELFSSQQKQCWWCGTVTAVAADTGVVVWRKVCRHFTWGCAFLDSPGNQHVSLPSFANSPGNSS